MEPVGVLLVRPVIGIDPSLTATGVAWPDGTTEVIKWKNSDVERLQNVAWWVEEHLPFRSHDPAVLRRRHCLVVIEGLSYGSKGAAVTGQAELGAVLRLTLHREGYPFVVIPPSVVKKYATGKGNANKDLVRDAARDRLGLPAGVTSDECDAAWLRQIGLRLVGDPAAVDVPKLHLTALDKVPGLEAALPSPSCSTSPWCWRTHARQRPSCAGAVLWPRCRPT